MSQINIRPIEKGSPNDLASAIEDAIAELQEHPVVTRWELKYASPTVAFITYNVAT